jgi:hypothetical protein
MREQFTGVEGPAVVTELVFVFEPDDHVRAATRS